MSEAIFLNPTEIKNAAMNFYGCCYYMLWVEGYNQVQITKYLKTMFRSSKIIVPPPKKCLVHFENKTLKSFHSTEIDISFLKSKKTSKLLSYDFKYYLDIPLFASASLASLQPLLELDVGSSAKVINSVVFKTFYKNAYLENLILITKQLKDAKSDIQIRISDDEWQTLYKVFKAIHSHEFFRITKKAQIEAKADFGMCPREVLHAKQRYKLASVKIPPSDISIVTFTQQEQLQTILNLVRKLSSKKIFIINPELKRDIQKIEMASKGITKIASHPYWTRLIQIHLKTTA
jgi:hypothetical protein